MRARRALLRRVRLDRAGRRIGLHVLLRDARRADRLDHRLGPDPRVRVGAATVASAGRATSRRCSTTPAITLPTFDRRRRPVAFNLPGDADRAGDHRVLVSASACRPRQHRRRRDQARGRAVRDRRGIGYVKPATGTVHPARRQPEAATGASTTPLIQTLLGQETSRSASLGIFTGAAMVFFAYIGFDIVATAAEETRNPQRDLPIGILASLAICTVLYIRRQPVVTGMVHYTKLDVDAPLAFAFQETASRGRRPHQHRGARGPDDRDDGADARPVARGLRDEPRPPPAAGALAGHPTYRTPYRISIIVGIAVPLLAGFVSLDTLADLATSARCSRSCSSRSRSWSCAAPAPTCRARSACRGCRSSRSLAVLASFYLMLNLVEATWIRFGVWMALGFVVYFLTGCARAGWRRATDVSGPSPGAGFRLWSRRRPCPSGDGI